MLQNIREGIQGPWAIGIVALIVVSFVFTGVGSYISSSNSGAVAIVNGEEIEANRLETTYQNERARLESQYGEAVNSLFASESYINQFRSDILQRLINERLVAQKAESLGLRVSDEQIKTTIAQMPEFQIAGAFDNQAYNSTLSRAGYTPAEFAEMLRGQMTQQQLDQALRGTAISLPYQVERVLALQEQTREVKSIEVDINKYQASIVLDEQEIQAYYNANLADFDTQEQVKLAYVTLSISDLKPQFSAEEEDVQQAYQDNIDAYTTAETRRVAHILFETSEGEELANSKALAVLEKLKAGESFESLAETHSDDVISAEEGGDLGVINLGDYNGTFEEAVFALTKAGDVSSIVETEFGLHIFKLTELTPSTVTPIDEVRAQLVEDIITNKATDEYFSLQSEMARLAFEESDSLTAVAEAISRPIIETEYFESGNLPPGVNYPQLNDIAFSSELIDEQVNSDLIELTQDLLMVTRVADHKPQRTRSLDEVRSQIEETLKIEKAQEQALIYAQGIQTALYNNEDVTALLAEHDLVWSTHESLNRNSSEIPREMVASAFTLSTDISNNISVVTTASGNVGIVQVSAVKPALKLEEDMLTNTKQSIANTQSQQTYQNFVEALRANSDITIVAQ